MTEADRNMVKWGFNNCGFRIADCGMNNRKAQGAWYKSSNIEQIEGGY